jgi:hypothetical protein
MHSHTSLGHLLGSLGSVAVTWVYPWVNLIRLVRTDEMG